MAALADQAEAASRDLHSPLAARRSPVATFGTWAPGRFHPGVDFSTGGVRMPVAAAADGEIVRVRASGSGYGNALHLRVTDGPEIVYAHLARFASPIQDSCRALQTRQGSYELDWTPPPGTFPVSKGGWVGWTGEAPDGRSLLHLELRVDGVPRNPWRNGFAWEDRDAPVIEAIEFVPLGADARINGRLDPLVVPVAAGGTSMSPPVLWGPVGVLCHAYDTSASSRCAPWRCVLDVDGAIVGESTAADEGAAGLWWDALDPEPAAVHEFRLPLFDALRGDRGVLAAGKVLGPGPHPVRITCFDAAGNADTTTLPIVVLPSPRMQEWIVRPLSRRSWDLAVKIAPIEGIDPERVRLWVDLTENGRTYPVHQPIGHLGDGYYFGTIVGHVPAGRIGMRVRLLTPDGREIVEPALSLDAEARCEAAAIDSPAVRVEPRWMTLSVPARCIPATEPKAYVRLDGRRLACTLLEMSQEGGQSAPPQEWTFTISPRASRAASAAVFELEAGGTHRAWRLDGVIAAGPRADVLYSASDGSMSLEAAAGTFYAPVWLAWSRSARNDGVIPVDELPRSGGPTIGQDEILWVRSDVHRLDPLGYRPDGSFRVTVRPRQIPGSPDEARRLLLYGRPDPASPWTPRGATWTGSGVTALVDRLEEWIVLEDQTEPWLYALRPGDAERIRPSGIELSAGVREDGAGIAREAIEIRLDGRRLPAKWNPGARRVTAVPDSSLAPGSHAWTILVRDRAGNTATREASFVVVEGP